MSSLPSFVGIELQREAAGSRQISGLPRSPATVENWINVSVFVSGWNNADLLNALTPWVTSKRPNAGTFRVRLSLGNTLSVVAIVEDVCVLTRYQTN